MSRNRKVSKSELVVSSGQLSFTAELEKKQQIARVFMQLLMEHCRNMKYIKTQVRWGDMNEDIRKRVMHHINLFQEWMSTLMEFLNGEYMIYPHKGPEFFLKIHEYKQELPAVADPFSANQLSEMLERALGRFRGMCLGYESITEPLLTDYVKGSINHLKRAYLAIK